MFCSKCGNPIPLDSEFCNKCGEKIQKYNNNEENNNINQEFNNNPVNNFNNSSIQTNNNGYNKLPNKNVLIIIGCIIGAIVLIFIGYNVFNQIRLHIIDNKVQEEANKLGDIDDFDTNKSNNSSSSQNNKRDYEVGDAVKLVDGSSWHVIGKKSDNELILLSDILAKDSSPYGSDASQESQKYENSVVKQYIEGTYLPTLRQSLLENNGDISNLNARLITANEYLNLTGDDLSEDYMSSNFNFSSTDKQRENKKWLSLTKSFWTMSNIREYTNSERYGAYSILVNGSTISLCNDYAAKGNAQGFIGSSYGIRPVIETSIENIK